MHEELKARLLAWTKTLSSFGLDSIGKDIAAALEAIEQLERQIAEQIANKERVEQETAEACAKLSSLYEDSGMNCIHTKSVAKAIRSGAWKEYK